MKLHLAPMEGVVDWVVRDTLTALGGIDQCVTEFIRVTDHVHSDKIFYEYCPELKTSGKTRSGVPVYIQLLGSRVDMLAQNALRACELGALGIDLNFGCPAKLVNRHGGGASLLKTPDSIYEILSAVRKIVPQEIPVTAKIRLGFDNPNESLIIAQSVAAAEISTLTVHCRTKTDMYKPPAFWEWIPKIKSICNLNIIANGDIWSFGDLVDCQKVTGCNEFMIGRGALRDPYIFSKIKRNIMFNGTSWIELRKIFPEFYLASEKFENKNFAVARTKQWLSQVAKNNIEANACFQEIKTIMNPEAFRERLFFYCH